MEIHISVTIQPEEITTLARVRIMFETAALVFAYPMRIERRDVSVPPVSLDHSAAS